MAVDGVDKKGKILLFILLLTNCSVCMNSKKADNSLTKRKVYKNIYTCSCSFINSRIRRPFRR